LDLREAIEEQKKRFWGEVAARVGKSAGGCERTAKAEKIQIVIM
jgi:hypothetical protein